MQRWKLNEQDIQQVLKDAEEYLRTCISPPDKVEIKLNKKLKGKARPIVEITREAGNKILALVDLAEKEIGWHGIVSREGNKFTIKDIYVYPQEVTGSTTEAIEDKYVEWICSLEDDEINNMRFHGHSHVNMAVFPSGVDTDYQHRLFNTVTDYYIFMIINKRKEFKVYLYDREVNGMYEPDDIECVWLGEIEANTWATQMIKDNVVEPARQYTFNQSTYNRPTSGYYDAYWDDLDDDDVDYYANLFRQQGTSKSKSRKGKGRKA